jgi:outer membrane protein assembly factor BamB
MASRTMVQNGLLFHELWRKGDLLIRAPMPAGVVASSKNVFFVDHNAGWDKRRLQVLDAATGQLQWSVPDLPNEWSMATDQVRLFIAVAWNIRAFNLSDGKLLWRTPGELPGHTGYSIYPMGADILVYSTESSFQKSEQILRTYDASNGTLKELSRTETTPTASFFRTLSVDYWADSEKLWAIDRSSGRTQWQVKHSGSSPHWPILTDSLIILSSNQFSGAPVELYAVDVRTGALVWRYAGRCLSNFVLTNNTLYAIREDTALVGIDLQTGREQGAINFVTTKPEDNTQYWVAATTDKVFAYFGDSQELIAFAQ